MNLPDVLFEFDSARLTRAARDTVREIASVTRGYSDRRIAVEGHTDSIGSAAYNQRLSVERANAVADEIAADMPNARLAVKGFGKSRPVASNGTEAGRRRNRRVEVIIENR